MPVHAYKDHWPPKQSSQPPGGVWRSPGIMPLPLFPAKAAVKGHILNTMTGHILDKHAITVVFYTTKVAL